MDSPRADTGPIEPEYSADNLLPPFLRTLADRIENKQLNDRQLRYIGEFFMSYLFNDQVEIDNANAVGSKDEESSEMSDKDFKKFLVLGWWIYSQVIPRVIDEAE